MFLFTSYQYSTLYNNTHQDTVFLCSSPHHTLSSLVAMFTVLPTPFGTSCTAGYIYIYISSRPPQSIKHTVDIYIIIYTPQSITHFKWTYKWLNCLWLNKKHQEIIFDAFMINNLLHHVGNNDKQFFVSLWTGIIFLSIGSSTFIILNY